MTQSPFASQPMSLEEFDNRYFSGSTSVQRREAQNRSRPVHRNIDRSFFDVTFGPFLAGGVETLEHLSRTAGLLIPGKDFLEDNADALKEIRQAHPEWEPEEIESWWELFSNPSSLYGHVTRSAGFLGASLLGYAAAGPLGVFATSYAIEGQSQYQRALAEGATEEQALQMGLYAGGISALVEVAQAKHIMMFAPKLRSRLARAGAENATLLGRKLGTTGLIGGALGWQFAIQGAEEALQGSAQDMFALGLYQSPSVKKGGVSGFLNNRMTEFIVGGTLGGSVSLAGLASNPQTRQDLTDLARQDLLSQPGHLKRQYYEFLRDKLNLTPDRAAEYVRLLEDDAAIFGERYGMDEREYLMRVFQDEGPIDTADLEGDTTSLEGPIAMHRSAFDAKDVLVGMEGEVDSSLTGLLVGTVSMFRRRTQGADHEALRAWLKLPDDVPLGPEHDAKIIKGLERYLRDGTLDSAGLKEPFDLFRRFASRVHKRMGRSGENQTGDFVGMLDTMLSVPSTPEVEAQRAVVKEHGPAANELIAEELALERQLDEGLTAGSVTFTPMDLTPVQAPPVDPGPVADGGQPSGRPVEIPKTSAAGLRETTPIRIQGSKANILSRDEPHAILLDAAQGTTRVIDAFSGTGMVANTIGLPAVRVEQHPQRAQALRDIQSNPSGVREGVEGLVEEVRKITGQGDVLTPKTMMERIRKLLQGWETDTPKYLVAQALSSHNESLKKVRTISMNVLKRKKSPDTIQNVKALDTLAESVTRMGKSLGTPSEGDSIVEGDGWQNL